MLKVLNPPRLSILTSKIASDEPIGEGLSLFLFTRGDDLNLILANVFLICFLWGVSETARGAETSRELFTQSMDLYAKGSFAESAKILSSLVGTEPQNSLYWFNLGNAYFMMQKYDKAILSYDKVVHLKSKMAPAARLYKAKALRKLNQTEEASDLLEGLLKDHPPAGILKEAKAELAALAESPDSEDEALSLYMNGRYEAAEKTLRQKPENELSPSGRLLLGLSLTKQNKLPEAERVLKALMRTRLLSAEDRKSAEEILKKIRREEWENRPYWLSVDMAYGSAHNIYLDGKSLSPLSSSLLRSSVGTGYHFHQGRIFSQKLGYILNYEDPQQAPELKTLTHTLQAPLIYEKPSLDLNLTPFFQHQSWGGVLASTKTGLLLKSAWTWSSVEAGVDTDVSWQKGGPEFSYLSGTSSSLRPYFGAWGQSVYVQIYWLEGLDGTQDIVYSDGTRLPLQHSYQGVGLKTIWKIADSASLVLGLNSTDRAYKNLALAGNKERRDRELSASLKLNYYWTPALIVYASYELTDNSSTLGAGDVRDKNYEATAASVGLSWEVFQ